jgi:hypothetical protein
VSVAVTETKILSTGRKSKTKWEAKVRYIYPVQVLRLHTVGQLRAGSEVHTAKSAYLTAEHSNQNVTRSAIV